MQESKNKYTPIGTAECPLATKDIPYIIMVPIATKPRLRNNATASFRYRLLNFVTPFIRLFQSSIKPCNNEHTVLRCFKTPNITIMLVCVMFCIQSKVKKTSFTLMLHHSPNSSFLLSIKHCHLLQHVSLQLQVHSKYWHQIQMLRLYERRGISLFTQI